MTHSTTPWERWKVRRTLPLIVHVVYTGEKPAPKQDNGARAHAWARALFRYFEPWMRNDKRNAGDRSPIVVKECKS